MRHGPWQFHLLSFEGPDRYSRAGGISSRISGLAQALADAGHDTHVWFIGDPTLPGMERVGRLTLHRWCQWISAHHPHGVYDGEEGKRTDYASSLPPFLLREALWPHLRRRHARAAILAEEWHTVHAVLHLDWLLRGAGVRDRVAILWNANNTFGFDRIDWGRLARAATITTVSRYMRYKMWHQGVDPLVIPNGLPPEAFLAPTRADAREFRARLGARLVLTKVARWDPDKRWLLAVDTVGALKRAGARPLLVARGGVEGHGWEVLSRATGGGLRIAAIGVREPGAAGVLDAVREVDDADLVVMDAPLDRQACQLLFGASNAVLANSGHEPFGLVALETMAAGGLACVGGTGEDYAEPGWIALVLQSQDPGEFVSRIVYFQAHPAEERALRRNARATASRYAWQEVVDRILLPRLGGERGRRRAAQAGVRSQTPWTEARGGSGARRPARGRERRSPEADIRSHEGSLAHGGTSSVTAAFPVP